MRPELHLTTDLKFGWWNKPEKNLRDEAERFIAQGRFYAAAQVLTRLQDARAEPYGMASAFADDRPLPRIVARNRQGDLEGPDHRWARSIIDRCRDFMKEGSSSRACLEEGARALENERYAEALTSFATLAHGHKDRWGHQLVGLCACAPYQLGDLQGTIAAYQGIGDEPSAWRYQALHLMKTTYLGFGAAEPTAQALASRLQAALPAGIEPAALLKHAGAFLKWIAEERSIEDQMRHRASDVVSAKGPAALGAGGLPSAFDNPRGAMGLFAASLKLADDHPAARLRAALAAHDAAQPAAQTAKQLVLGLVRASRNQDHETYDALLSEVKRRGLDK